MKEALAAKHPEFFQVTHEQLDELFRANNERAGFQPSQEEWEEMTRMLDEDERQERYAQWVSAAWIVMFVMLILVGITGAWYYSQAGSTIRNTPIAGQIPQASTSVTAPSTRGQVEESKFSSADSPAAASTQANPFAKPAPSDPGSPASSTSVKTSLTEASTANLNQTKGSAEISSPKQGTAATKSTTIQASAKTGLTESSKPAFTPQADNNNSIVTKPPVANMQSGEAKRVLQETAATTLSEQDTGEQKSDLTALRNFAILALPFSTLQALDASQGLKLPKQLPNRPPYNTSSAAEKSDFVPARSLTSPSRLSYGVFLNEGVSWIDQRNNKPRLLSRVGLLANYAFNDNWLFEIGASYAYRGFLAHEDRFHDPEGIFVHSGHPAWTEGRSHLLEFPVSIWWLPQGKTRNSWYLNGGLSSGLVIRESMEFGYHHSAPGQIYEMSSDKTGSLRLGSALFSAGYVLRTKQAGSWRLGPLLEAPIQGIGYGQVELYSVAFQLGYVF